ncbi:hypothetical protein HHI36_016537 [Cryptolaemus montrouzieri]|uniref:PHD-type domain-containing protein n=1 Tax=Cryptolaemus montrouzieri TaxID=559131 RepID=A0ABD2NJY9_9CUCU
MNTCPVDRQEYHLIHIRKKLNGRIVRQIPIKKPEPPEIPTEDQTFCEICGSGDREDRLLLCDGCDLGFHLECLTPPLQEVPVGSWYCNECDPEETYERELDIMEIHFLLEDQEIAVTPRNMRRNRTRSTTRLIPRTQQSERVRTRIMNNRSYREEVQEPVEEPSSSTPSVHTSNIRIATKQKNKSTKSRKRGSRKRTKRYRTVYEIDDDGEIISKKKQVRGRKMRKKKVSRRNRRNQLERLPKTVKKRLAQQLGICPMKLPAQSLPDVKIQGNNSNLNSQRYHAGIPTLHLFGPRDDLDYFSASDEDIGGPGYLVRRRPNHNDVAQFRRAARRKGVVLSPPAAVSSTSDLLGSILDSQSKFYSKNTDFSLDNSGKFRMENKKENSNNNVELGDFNKLTKQTPYGGNNHDGRRNQQPYSNNSSYQSGSSYYQYDNFGHSGSADNYMPFAGPQGSMRGAGNYDQDMPQDYTQSTLSSYDRDLDFDNPRRNEEQQQQLDEDSDIDIYSDIEESVSTSKIEDTTPKPLNLSPGVNSNVVPNNGSDIENENNDSDNDMVIDTEKVEPQSQEEVTKEDNAVTSSVDTIVKCNSTSDATSVPHSTSEIESEAVQSSFEESKEDAEDDEDAFSEDGCPNFNIYSTESINLAKNTDITLNSDDKPEENHQVVSSTPAIEVSKPSEASCYKPADVYDPESAYDPEAAYNSEKESEGPGANSEADDAYDPERVYDTPEDTYDPEKTFEEDENSEEKKTSQNKIKNDESKKIEDIPKQNDSNPISVPTDRVEDSPEELRDSQKSEEPQATSSTVKAIKPKGVNLNVLYSDSEDEEVVKISSNSFTMGDISTMTEDVSEEERSYTPCLDEKASIEKGKGPDGLDTEMISDDEKNNDFDESHEQKAASEGDALEINAKEFEMDLIRPEDYEEGEIVDKNKANKEKQLKENSKEPEDQVLPGSTTVEAEVEKVKNDDKENEPKEKQQSFKKLSKNNKERNYRDKDRSKSRDRRGKDKEKDRENTKEKRKDKRKEIERYDVRALIAEKPRRLKDKFGRDVRKSSSKSRSRSRSKSYTPKRSPVRRTSPRRLSSASREERRKKRSGSSRRSISKSRSRSRSRRRKRSLSGSRRRRSRSRSKRKRKTSKDRSKRRKRLRSSSRTYTPSRKRRKDWEDRYSKERGFSPDGRWTPSMSRTPEMEPPRHASPSWTPPRVMESAAVDPRNLTVILQNDQNKKKKDRKKKGGKKRDGDKRNKRRRKDRTPPPSKEVFASGDNILVSVSFNKENETRERDVFTKRRKEADDRERRKRSVRRKKKNQELSGIKPVAIIDLERSPFRELTPSPKDIIILSDEEHVENSNINDSQDVCDSSQQVASPETVPVYMTGPKTPPEPQVKFTLPSKQQPLRPLLINPLHDPEDEVADDAENENREEHDLSDTHKGPNTPPEPPNSPPSSPDAYDPFEPTKSRSPSPDPVEVSVVEDTEKRNNLSDHLIEKSTTLPSLTPPIADVQPADSQSSLQISRDSSKSPDPLGRSIQPSMTKSTIQSTSVAAPLTSTPISTNSGQGRINILNTTILSNVSSTIPQRIVLPNVKLSPVKAQVKNVIKSTPIKPMPNKNNTNTTAANKSKPKNTQQNGNDSSEVISLDFDSPYSPGSSDYEDLFEPPPEVVTKKTLSKSAPTGGKESSGGKAKNTFDALFGSPMNKIKKVNVEKSKSKKSRGTKIIGVKLDEDHLKILDELPNSAVEMQVKDKFLKKLNRQERVVEEVKLVLKPYYNKKKIDKEEYKDIMRRAVPKVGLIVLYFSQNPVHIFNHSVSKYVKCVIVQADN